MLAASRLKTRCSRSQARCPPPCLASPNPNPTPTPSPTPNQAHAAFKPLPRAQGEGFCVSHFAGPVGYHIDGFVEKSRDALPGERE